MYKLFFLLHFFGAILMFTAVGINLASLIWMAFSKETKRIRICSLWSARMGKFLPFTIILLLVSSFYLVFSKWDWEFPWIDVSLVILLILTVSSFAIDLPRLKAIQSAAAAETATTPSVDLTEKVRDHVLWNSVSILTMEVAAIIHIMIEKLGAAGSLMTPALALILGLLFSKTVLHLANRLNPAVVHKETVNL
jgi:hypothetical protein